MTLIEVAIATTLFSIFALAFVSGQGSNVLDSVRMKQELYLKDLAELKLNEIILDPPKFEESLTETGKEEKPLEDFPGYKYVLEFKKLTLPDFAKLMGKGEEGEDNAGDEDPQLSQIQDKISATVIENMEKMVWQVSLTVIHEESQNSFEVNSWLHNHKAQVALSGF